MSVPFLQGRPGIRLEKEETPAGREARADVKEISAFGSAGRFR
jgi:hypothetical protein